MNNEWNINWKEVDQLILKYSNSVVSKMTGYHITSIQKRRKAKNYPKIDSVDERWRHIDPMLGTMSDRQLGFKFGEFQSKISYRRRSLNIPKYEAIK